MVNRKIGLIIVICILILSGTLGGYLVACYYSSHWIAEQYYREIVFADDIVFDEQEAVAFYGNTVLISAGSRGVILEAVDYYGDTKGYELINVRMHSANDQYVEVALDISTDAVKRVEGNVLITGIDSVESSEKILAEYEQIHDKINKRVISVRVIGTTIGFAISVVISAALLVISLKHSKKSSTVA